MNTKLLVGCILSLAAAPLALAHVGNDPQVAYVSYPITDYAAPTPAIACSDGCDSSLAVHGTGIVGSCVTDDLGAAQGCPAATATVLRGGADHRDTPCASACASSDGIIASANGFGDATPRAAA